MERSARSALNGNGDGHSEAIDGLMVVDRSLRVFALDRGAGTILKEVNEQRANAGTTVCLPPEIRALLTGCDFPVTNLRLVAGDVQYSCRVFLMKPQNQSNEEGLFAIHLKRDASVKESIHRVACTYRLTEREKEAVIGIAMGLTSRELAGRMNISPNTVNSFLRVIMVKMGVSTRAGVVGKLLEEDGVRSGGGLRMIGRAVAANR